MNIQTRVAAGKPFIVKSEDLHHYATDTVKQPVAATVNALKAAGYAIIFVSGRTEIGRDITRQQIQTALTLPDDHQLFMRKNGDYRPDHEIKHEIYTQQIQPEYDVLLVLDDRNSVVDFWRSIGLTCFQVAPGNF